MSIDTFTIPSSTHLTFIYENKISVDIKIHNIMVNEDYNPIFNNASSPKLHTKIFINGSRKY